MRRFRTYSFTDYVYSLFEMWTEVLDEKNGDSH